MFAKKTFETDTLLAYSESTGRFRDPGTLSEQGHPFIANGFDGVLAMPGLPTGSYTAERCLSH